MLLYSKRKKLADIFEAWAAETNAAITSTNLISFLQGYGLLDEYKIRSFLAEKEADHERI